MLFLRANLLVLSVCSGQRPLKIRMPSVLPPGILIWLGMSATSFEVSEPGTLHVHLACCACSACSASHLRRFMRRTSRPPQRLAWHEALSWQPARPFFGSMELPMIWRSKSREDVSWLRRLASDRRLQTNETSRPPQRLAWHEALSWHPARLIFGSVELPMVRRSKNREDISWLRRLASK